MRGSSTRIRGRGTREGGMRRTLMKRILGLGLVLFADAAAQEGRPVFKAGFAEVEITPPLGTPKQGSNSKTVASSVLDPLYARAAVFELGTERMAILQLDTALILAGETAAIRKRVEKDHGLAGGRVMTAATHRWPSIVIRPCVW